MEILNLFCLDSWVCIPFFLDDIAVAVGEQVERISQLFSSIQYDHPTTAE